MPFFCFIVYNGHTLCLINVIGPINVFGKFIFFNFFTLAVHVKFKLCTFPVFRSDSTGISRFKMHHIFVGEMSVWWGWSRFEKRRSVDLLWTSLLSASESRIDPPTPSFGLIISQSMKHTSCFNPGVKRKKKKKNSLWLYYFILVPHRWLIKR